jgi:hypothetical protein
MFQANRATVMTSERMIAANRSNGRRGRGPQTAPGKARSSRNALRHGLAVSILGGPAMFSQVEKLARIIAGAGADDAQLDRARVIAGAQLDLVRIRDFKAAILNSLAEKAGPSSTPIPGELTISSEERKAGFESENYEGCMQDLAMTSTILRQLSRLERYECRAISRRRQAMRAFLVVQPFGTNAEL